MRIKLKGINRITKRLADGSSKTYYYAWKGGPALVGRPGTPEFVAGYNKACNEKILPKADTVANILSAYSSSPEFAELGERTKSDYLNKLIIIERQFGDVPLEALSDRRMRRDFMEWRKQLALKSKRQTDYVWSVLS
ncbi:MAG: integrase, partial [Afipia sp.]|nr:integrase [Afipia sp.]